MRLDRISRSSGGDFVVFSAVVVTRSVIKTTLATIDSKLVTNTNTTSVVEVVTNNARMFDFHHFVSQMVVLSRFILVAVVVTVLELFFYFFRSLVCGVCSQILTRLETTSI